MNIAYYGDFLHEGLLQAGHNVIPIQPGKSRPLSACLKDITQPVDLVFLELFGNSLPPDAIDSCGHQLAAWCIDTPINGFWLKDACALFDHVLADQKPGAQELKKNGIEPAWLPLCAQNSWFRKKQPKIYDITFIGKIDQHRIKRFNLLRRVSSCFHVNIVERASYEEAADIFARSKIVLNENFFPGLTLRVFQALASGSLLASEAGGCGVSDFFMDGRDILEFSPDTFLEKLDHFLADDAGRESIAAGGNEKCGKFHSSMIRAQQAIEAIKTGKAGNKRLPEDEFSWRRLCARQLFTLRFGGNLEVVLKEFCQLARLDSPFASEAALKAGDIFSIGGNPVLAEKYYRSATGPDCGHSPFSRLAMLYLLQDEMFKARHYMELAARKISDCGTKPDLTPPAALKDEKARILFLASKIHAAEGKLFDPGFHKTYRDTILATSFEAARQLWLHEPSPLSMQLMLDALAPSGLQGELLPELLKAVKSGALSKEQCLRAAELAYSYYDLETADKFISRYQ